jgi:serine/threonine protein kinase
MYKKGTPLYMAPECYAERFGHRESYFSACDIYAFGITMCEMFSRCIPFDDVPMSLNLGQAVLNGVRPQIPPRCPHELRELIERCWHHDPLQRPRASDLARNIKDLYTLYIDRNEGDMPLRPHFATQ